MIKAGLFLFASLGLAAPALAQLGLPVSDTELGQVAGKTDIAQAIRATNATTLTNNQVTGNSVTGVISISDTALSNINGLAIISANTGNNVAINSSLNVNVSIHP